MEKLVQLLSYEDPSGSRMQGALGQAWMQGASADAVSVVQGEDEGL